MANALSSLSKAQKTILKQSSELKAVRAALESRHQTTLENGALRRRISKDRELMEMQKNTIEKLRKIVESSLMLGGSSDKILAGGNVAAAVLGKEINVSS